MDLEGPEVEPARPALDVEPELALSTPEPALAALVPPPEPPRPLPSSRRAIFFDVENTSRAEHIARVLAHLAVDRGGRRTDFFAVGNWRVIGHDTARLLARHGAALVHSAPSVGVRDWSDLRIAVASGVWLAGARPGDVIEIVSDDRAFDAVGDVAASLGVSFRRLSYRGLLGVSAPAPVEVEVAVTAERHGGYGDARGGRRRQAGGRGRGRGEHSVSRGSSAAPAPAPSRAEPRGEAEPHTAPHDEIVSVVRELAGSGRAVTLDSLANALKARGFARPPGSPRLITRLRRIKELEVSRSGVITLVGEAAGAAAEPAEREAEPAVLDALPEPGEPEPLPESMDAGAEVEAAEAGNQTGHAASGGEGEQRRRRSRRGGRRRRGRGGSGSEGGGGGGEPPRGRDSGPRDSGPRGTGADRARDVASRYAPRDAAPSWISGQPLA